MKIADYRRVIDPIVQPQTFKPQWGILAHVVAHIAFITGVSLAVARNLGEWPAWVIAGLALLTGHSVACLGFAAHEIGHGTAVRRKGPMYVWETLTWVYTLAICTSIHRKAHFMHHAYLNGARDPNARPTLEEMSQDPGKDVSEWFFPNSKHPRASAFAGLWLVNLVYQMKLLFSSLLKNGTRFDMNIPRAQAWMGVVETFGFNLGTYVALWAASGFHLGMLGYLFLMNYVGTTLGLLYICTNHLMNPAMGDHVDPLELSLTVRVPRWANFLHLRFSYHNEHHLYPKAGPRYYPVIREALLQHFPERYNEMTFGQAMKAMTELPIAHLDRNTLVDIHGEGARSVTFPSKEASEPVLAGS